MSNLFMVKGRFWQRHCCILFMLKCVFAFWSFHSFHWGLTSLKFDWRFLRAVAALGYPHSLGTILEPCCSLSCLLFQSKAAKLCRVPIDMIDILSISVSLIALVIVTRGVSSIFVAFSSYRLYNLKLYSDLSSGWFLHWFTKHILQSSWMHGQLTTTN